jgi:hypothetical protein
MYVFYFLVLLLALRRFTTHVLSWYNFQLRERRFFTDESVDFGPGARRRATPAWGIVPLSLRQKWGKAYLQNNNPTANITMNIRATMPKYFHAPFRLPVIASPLRNDPKAMSTGYKNTKCPVILSLCNNRV